MNSKNRRKNLEIRDFVAPLADEPHFKRMLLMERRRCERSGSRFALMLVDLEGLIRTLSAPQIEEIASAISASMRETDLTGWYQHPSMIGVILTTLNETEGSTIETVVLERTQGVLKLHLDGNQLQRIRISCHVFPEKGDSTATKGKSEFMFYSEHEKRNSKSKLPTVLKRTVDILGSLSALVLLLPLFLIIAVVVKLTSTGPVFFKQKRVGQFGREFTFLKFRSMAVNCDNAIHKEYIQNLIEKKMGDSIVAHKIKNDPRITPVGRILRKSSLDELPQFLNVLKGEMSLVGPRPPIPYEFESYSLWHRRRILEAKPGITGPWQVEGRSRTTFDDMVRMDLRYIRNQSVWVDVKILLKTPVAVIKGNGAY